MSVIFFQVKGCLNSLGNIIDVHMVNYYRPFEALPKGFGFQIFWVVSAP